MYGLGQKALLKKITFLARISFFPKGTSIGLAFLQLRLDCEPQIEHNLKAREDCFPKHKLYQRNRFLNCTIFKTATAKQYFHIGHGDLGKDCQVKPPQLSIGLLLEIVPVKFRLDHVQKLTPKGAS